MFTYEKWFKGKINKFRRVSTFRRCQVCKVTEYSMNRTKKSDAVMSRYSHFELRVARTIKWFIERVQEETREAPIMVLLMRHFVRVSKNCQFELRCSAKTSMWKTSSNAFAERRRMLNQTEQKWFSFWKWKKIFLLESNAQNIEIHSCSVQLMVAVLSQMFTVQVVAAVFLSWQFPIRLDAVHFVAA